MSRNWVYLAPKRKSSYKQLFVKDRRIAAYTLYCDHINGVDGEGMTPEEVAYNYDVPVEAVREAIAYCQSNPPELREDWEMDEALAQATDMNHPDDQSHPSPKLLSPEDRANLDRS